MKTRAQLWMHRVAQPYVLFFILALGVLALLWSSTINLIRVERASAESTASALSTELVDTYEAQVVRALREIDQTLKFVKYVYELKGPEKLLQELRGNAILPPEILFIVSISDAQGNIIASTRAEQKANVSQQDYFIAQQQRRVDGMSIGQPPPGPVDEQNLHFARRLNAPDGSFAGIVSVAVNAAYFVSGYEEAKLGRQGIMGILGLDGVFRVRRSGDIIYAGDRGEYAHLLPSSDSVIERIEPSVSNWDGVVRYASARELYEFPVVVLVGVSQVEQLADTNRLKNTRLGWAAAGTIVTLIVFTILARLTAQLARSRQRETQAAVEHAARVEYLAFHDSLTGLPNRTLFSKLLAQSIAQAQRYNRQMAVLFLDLDRFKDINDTLGHDAGDELLKEVAKRLKASLRESDTVARMGGDEFVAILPELDEEKYVATVARKILLSTAEPFILLGQEFRVTASIGVAIYPQDGLDEQTLTKNADIAMYHAKEEGKNNFQLFSKTLASGAFERLALESSLRHALDRNEFELHYHPRRDLPSGRITGMEALLRWQHPGLGTVAPMQFIPIAEETGLIVPIGKWVLQTACEQNMAWRREGLPDLTIDVNMTARQFFDENLLRDLKQILLDTEMPPHLLELEITEGLLMQDVDRALRVLTGLKELGVRIAIDDFGVGYSSLATLERFPIDTVKIDRSFIRDVANITSSQGLTAAVIAIGRNLSLNVVAQGVETKEQADFLRERACNEFQGFYFDKPAPPDQFEQLLRAQGSMFEPA